MSLENRSRVLRAATSSFLAHGYGSSVDHIARRAGVAKQTVYSHFPSKDLLFQEVARDLAKRVLVELEGEDLRATLMRFASAYRKRALGAQGIATFRTLVPEVPRWRPLARKMYDMSAGELVRRLAAYLGEAITAGKLARVEPEFAAEMLLSMLAGQDRIKRLFGVPAGANERARTADIVDCFLKAFQK